MKDLFKNEDNDYIYYRYYISFKNNNLNKDIKNAIYFTIILLDNIRKSVISLIIILYKLNKRDNINSKKSNKELLLKTLIETF